MRPSLGPKQLCWCWMAAVALLLLSSLAAAAGSNPAIQRRAVVQKRDPLVTVATTTPSTSNSGSASSRKASLKKAAGAGVQVSTASKAQGGSSSSHRSSSSNSVHDSTHADAPAAEPNADKGAAGVQRSRQGSSIGSLKSSGSSNVAVSRAGQHAGSSSSKTSTAKQQPRNSKDADADAGPAATVTLVAHAEAGESSGSAVKATRKSSSSRRRSSTSSSSPVSSTSTGTGQSGADDADDDQALSNTPDQIVQQSAVRAGQDRKARGIKVQSFPADLDAAVTSMGLQALRASDPSVGGTGRAGGGGPAASLFAAAMPLAAWGGQLTGTAGQQQQPPVLGGASAGLLFTSMSNVAHLRDIALRLATKPNLMQHVKEKQVRQVADALDGTDVAAVSAIPGLLGLPSVYRAGGDIDSQLFAKKTAIAVAITLFSHMTPEQAVVLAGMLIPGYVMPGLTFYQLNRRLYEGGAVSTQLDELFDAIMSQTTQAASLGDGGADAGADAATGTGSDVAEEGSVDKSAKTAGFLLLGLLLQARGLVCGI